MLRSGLSKETGSAGQHGEEPDSACVQMRLELARSKRNAICLHKARVFCFLAWGRAAKRHNLNPPCQNLALLGTCACILQAWGARVHRLQKALNPLSPCRAVGLRAACCMENWVLSPDHPLGSPISVARFPPVLCSLTVYFFYNDALHQGLYCALLRG